MDTHQRILRVLKRGGTTKPKQHTFPYTGLMRCGVCGLMVTAEHKINAYGSRYTYYHCTKRGNGERCRQPSIDATTLHTSLRKIIANIDLPAEAHAVNLLRLRELLAAAPSRRVDIPLLAREINDVRHQLSAIVTMRSKEQIDEADFLARRRALDVELLELQDRQRKMQQAKEPLELSGLVISLRSRAIAWFDKGSDELRRLILKTVGSNYRLTDRNVSGEATEPFDQRVEEPRFLYWCGVGDDVRTEFEPLDIASQLETIANIERIIAMAEAEGLGVLPRPWEAHVQESNKAASLVVCDTPHRRRLVPPATPSPTSSLDVGRYSTP